MKIASSRRELYNVELLTYVLVSSHIHCRVVVEMAPTVLLRVPEVMDREMAADGVELAACTVTADSKTPATPQALQKKLWKRDINSVLTVEIATGDLGFVAQHTRSRSCANNSNQHVPSLSKRLPGAQLTCCKSARGIYNLGHEDSQLCAQDCLSVAIGFITACSTTRTMEHLPRASL